MKSTITDFKKNPVDFLRSCGYAFDRQTGEEWSCMRRLAGLDYPRFHAYIKLDGSSLVINLHLDQKKPSYGTNHAHSGEYDGEIIEREMERIRGRT